MASLELRGNTYRVKFRHGGRQFGASLETSEFDAAEAKRKRLEANLHEVEHGRLIVPPGADLCVFLLSDGKAAEKTVVEKVLRLSDLFQKYRDSGNGKEANTRYTETIHMAHLERLLGGRQSVPGLTPDLLQGYVNCRAEESGKRGKVSPKTIQKEIGTLASIWNKFAVPQGLAKGPAPTKGLVFHKEKGKAPFQTWEQIERRIARGGLTADQQHELWESLFLSRGQVEELLRHIKGNARTDWVYPMAVFAAYTGARRSEMMRSEMDDIDFDEGTVRIREKKKDQSKDMTFRHVPLSPFLAEILRAWSAQHPGGKYTFCQQPDEALTPPMATHQFVRAIEDSKWAAVPGWHCLRHSFCSNCAAAGIDQRMISAWMGHQTAEMEARYRHLFPHQEKEALAKVFGGPGPSP